MLAPLVALALATAPIKVGDPAPDFTLLDQDGNAVTLSKLLAKGPVILAFYPRAMTPGCTRQNEALRDRMGDIEARGAQVLGISTDPRDRLREFKESSRLPYPLLWDPEGKIIDRYVGRGLLGMSNRANVVVGQDGKVTAVIEGGDAIDPAGAIAACPLGKGTP